MPTCKLCGIYFKNLLKIDGKIKRLQARKYCLQCSPYRQGNNKDLTKQPFDFKCSKCLIIKSSDNYYGKSKVCRLCHTIKSNERKRAFKAMLVNENGGGCLLCGYAKCFGALSFHHVHKNTKDFCIADVGCLMSEKSVERVRQEIKKCVLLCANCHQELHAGLVKLPENCLGMDIKIPDVLYAIC